MNKPFTTQIIVNLQLATLGLPTLCEPTSGHCTTDHRHVSVKCETLVMAKSVIVGQNIILDVKSGMLSKRVMVAKSFVVKYIVVVDNTIAIV